MPALSPLTFSQNIKKDDLPSHKEPKARLSIIFSPFFSDHNPYQNQLSNSLERLGVQVSSDYGKIFLPMAVQRSKAKLVHLHWLHRVTKASNIRHSLLKVLKFSLGIALLKVLGIKIIWTVHNLQDHERTYPRLDKYCNFLTAKTADVIITHSQTSQQIVASTFNLANRQDKLFVIPHGHYINYYPNRLAQETARKRLGLPESATVFLFFGLLRAYKGIPELIEAFESLQADNDIYLVIAGQAKDQRLTEQLNIQTVNNPKIKLFPQFIPDNEIQVFMNACDVVVLPYRNLLTSGSVVLAMSFSKACIAPQLGCLNEILDEAGAFTYNADDQTGLSDAMQRAITSKDKVSAMGQHNLEIVSHLHWDFIAEETLTVYKTSLSH